MKAEKQISIKKSWGKETLKFKVDKKNNNFDKAVTYCQGKLCNARAKEKEERNKAPKGEECASCYNEDFKSLRLTPETPSFDTDFLTRTSQR